MLLSAEWFDSYNSIDLYSGCTNYNRRSESKKRKQPHPSSHNWAPLATIKLANILPRESRFRNEVICETYFMYRLKRKDISIFV